MKLLSVVLFLASWFCLSACTEQAQVVEILQNDCEKFVELNYSNYDSLKTDPLNVLEAKIEGDCLHLSLQYGGGCRDHNVDLALIFPECGTPPLPPTTFEIRHDAKGDVCKALITKDYSFDLSGIREPGKNKTDFILSARNSSGVFTNMSYTYHY